MWKTLVSISMLDGLVLTAHLGPVEKMSRERERERERERGLRFPYYYWDLVWTSVLRLKQSRARSQHDMLPIFLSRKESNKRKLTRKRRGFCFPKNRPFLSFSFRLQRRDPLSLPSNFLFFFYFQNAPIRSQNMKKKKNPCCSQFQNLAERFISALFDVPKT